jgi:ribonuclease P protein component
MLGRSHRFHGYGSLKAVYQRGRNLRGPALNLRVAQRNPAKPYRVAVVVSRKVSKSAVVRNRIRRRIYEIVRHTDAVIAPGTDLVFTVYSDQVATIEIAKLQAQVADLLRKAAA